jgi:hypothetical protein
MAVVLRDVECVHVDDFLPVIWSTFDVGFPFILT